MSGPTKQHEYQDWYVLSGVHMSNYMYYQGQRVNYQYSYSFLKVLIMKK